MTIGTNTPEMRSASFWIGGLEACACSTSRAICASAVRLPTAVAAMSIAPSTFRVPPMSVSPGPFSTGSDSPVTMDSSTDAWPARTLPSTGIASPGLTRSRSPTATSERATSLLDAVAHPPRHPGREIEQPAHRSRRFAPRPGLEVAPEQDEREDHAHGLVVHVTHRPGKDARKGRRKQSRGQRETERRRRADRDERIHVGRAVAQGSGGARKKRRSGPQVDRQREPEQDPVAAREHDVRHRDDRRRNREGGRHERPAQDVAHFGAAARLLFLGARVERGPRVVAARPHGGHEPAGVEVGAAHVRARRREIDRGAFDAGNRGEGVLDRRDARGAVHAVEGKRKAGAVRRREAGGGRQGKRSEGGKQAGGGVRVPGRVAVEGRRTAGRAEEDVPPLEGPPGGGRRRLDGHSANGIPG